MVTHTWVGQVSLLGFSSRVGLGPVPNNLLVDSLVGLQFVLQLANNMRRLEIRVWCTPGLGQGKLEGAWFESTYHGCKSTK